MDMLFLSNFWWISKMLEEFLDIAVFIWIIYTFKLRNSNSIPSLSSQTDVDDVELSVL